jgi:ATP-dependent RNA helicase DDX46/PRP5
VDDEDFFKSNVPKRKQKKELIKVDHSKFNYPPFRKNFYIEVPEITKMSKEEIDSFKKVRYIFIC